MLRNLVNFGKRLALLKRKEKVDGTLVVEIAPSESAEAIIVLYDLAFIQNIHQKWREYPFFNVC